MKKTTHTNTQNPMVCTQAPIPVYIVKQIDHCIEPGLRRSSPHEQPFQSSSSLPPAASVSVPGQTVIKITQ